MITPLVHQIRCALMETEMQGLCPQAFGLAMDRNLYLCHANIFGVNILLNFSHLLVHFCNFHVALSQVIYGHRSP